ncbi:MAG: hypothetical protein ACPGXL_06940 [Chitinophagales bacterium]
MTQLFKDTVYTGVGLAAFAAEKIQSALADLGQQRQDSLVKGEKLVNQFVDEAQEEVSGLSGRVKAVAADVIERLDLVTENFQEELSEFKEDLMEKAEVVVEEATELVNNASEMVTSSTEKAQTMVAEVAQ